MSGGDYLLGLLSIITGLAISDMIASLHGLLLDRRKVQWDWLTILAAAYIFVLIVVSWGISYRSFHSLRVGVPVWIFVIALWQLIPVYLAARAIIPDDIRVGTAVDLTAHYAFVSRYVWTALSLSALLFVGLSVFFGGPLNVITQSWDVLVITASCLLLALSRSRRLHIILVPLLVVWLCLFHMTNLLGG